MVITPTEMTKDQKEVEDRRKAVFRERKKAVFPFPFSLCSMGVFDFRKQNGNLARNVVVWDTAITELGNQTKR
jgi:hypothetical protein